MHDKFATGLYFKHPKIINYIYYKNKNFYIKLKQGEHLIVIDMYEPQNISNYNDHFTYHTFYNFFRYTRYEFLTLRYHLYPGCWLQQNNAHYSGRESVNVKPM